MAALALAAANRSTSLRHLAVHLSSRAILARSKHTARLVAARLAINWQTGPFVLGVETDIQGADISDNQTVTIAPYLFAPNSISVTTNSKLDWFGTVRGRIGVAWDRLLIYATGGYAYGSLNYGIAKQDTFHSLPRTI